MIQISDQLLTVVRAAIRTMIALHSRIKNQPRLQLKQFWEFAHNYQLRLIYVAGNSGNQAFLEMPGIPVTV
jgi:hypothetical protein